MKTSLIKMVETFYRESPHYKLGDHEVIVNNALSFLEGQGYTIDNVTTIVTQNYIISTILASKLV